MTPFSFKDNTPRCHKRPGRFPKDSGVSYLETAIILPLFLLLTFVIIDVGVWAYKYGVMQYAAFEAVSRAAKLDMEIDTTFANCNVNTAECQTFNNQVKEITDIAVQIASLAVDPAKLVEFEHYDSIKYAGKDWIRTGHEIADFKNLAGFLRPGEVIFDLSNKNQPLEINHPTRPFGTGVGEGWPHPGERWTNILHRNPIIVKLKTFYDPIVPFAPIITIEAQQWAYSNWKKVGVEAPPALCPDFVCQSSEDCSTCPQDCGVCNCPSGTCEAGESCATCPQDCGLCPDCPNGICDPSELCSTCPQDCGACPTCPDGVCSNEDCTSCPQDCGACVICGDHSCDAGENANNCCVDCATIGDGVCSGLCGENCSTAPADCGACILCPNGVCDSSESCNSCPQDCGACPPVCGNNVCEAGENVSNCCQDCGSIGDAVCSAGCGETCATAPADCGPCVLCPDGICNGGENCSICPQDCGVCPPTPVLCGNGLCEIANGENIFNCCKDCAKVGDGKCSSCIKEDCNNSPADCPCPAGQNCTSTGFCANKKPPVVGCNPVCSGCGLPDGCGGICGGANCPPAGKINNKGVGTCGDGVVQPGEDCENSGTCGADELCQECVCVPMDVIEPPGEGGSLPLEPGSEGGGGGGGGHLGGSGFFGN